MHHRLPSLPDTSGAFLDHDAILRAIDEQLGFVAPEEVQAAERRSQSALSVPTDVRLSGESLGVA